MLPFDATLGESINHNRLWYSMVYPLQPTELQNCATFGIFSGFIQSTEESLRDQFCIWHKRFYSIMLMKVENSDYIYNYF